MSSRSWVVLGFAIIGLGLWIGGCARDGGAASRDMEGPFLGIVLSVIVYSIAIPASIVCFVVAALIAKLNRKPRDPNC